MHMSMHKVKIMVISVVVVALLCVNVRADIPNTIAIREQYWNSQSCSDVSPSVTAIFLDTCILEGTAPSDHPDAVGSYKRTVNGNQILAKSYHALDCSGDPIEQYSWSADIGCSVVAGNQSRPVISNKWSISVERQSIWTITFYSDNQCTLVQRGPDGGIVGRCAGMNLMSINDDRTILTECPYNWNVNQPCDILPPQTLCNHYTVGECRAMNNAPNPWGPPNWVYFKYDVLNPDPESTSATRNAAVAETSSMTNSAASMRMHLPYAAFASAATVMIAYALRYS